MEVAAVAGQVRERLRHEGRQQPALLGQGLDHVAEEDGPVARRQRVGELEVLLELAVGVLVVGRIVVPSEPGDRLGDLGDEVEVAGQRPHVVTGQVERVERVSDLDPAVLGPAHEEVLELGADLQLVALVGGTLERVAQDRPRAERPLLALDGDVAGKARDGRTPRQDRQRRRIGHRDHVGVVRTLAEIAGREPGEAGSVIQQVVEVVGGDELRARLAVHVDELGEQEFDPLVLDDPANVIFIFWWLGHGSRYIPRDRSGTMATGTPLPVPAMCIPHIGELPRCRSGPIGWSRSPRKFTRSARRTGRCTASSSSCLRRSRSRRCSRAWSTSRPRRPAATRASSTCSRAPS